MKKYEMVNPKDWVKKHPWPARLVAIVSIPLLPILIPILMCVEHWDDVTDVVDEFFGVAFLPWEVRE